MSFFSKYLSRETSSVRLSLNPNFTLVFGLIFSLVLSNLILNGMVIGVSAQSIPQPNNQSANQTPNQPQPLSPTNQTSTNNPNSSPTQPQSSPSTDPYSEQVTKTVRNGADGSGSTTLKIGTEIRDDSPLAVREYARLNPNDAGIQSAFNSGTLVCTQMGGRIGGDNSPAKLEVEDGKGGIKEVDVPIAHPSRRIGICQDGFYSLSNRMIDTAGNVGEWTESKVIERDTVSPLVPVVEVSKSGDIWAEYLSLNLSKAEAGSTATIEVFLNPDKDSSDVGTIVKTFTAVIPEDANYTNTNLIGKLLCGGGKYSIRVKLTDRALNGSEYSEFQSITTKDCPRCGYSGGEFAIPIRNDLQNRPVQWVVTQDFDSHGGSIDLATLGVENFGHGIPVYPIAPGKVVVAKYQGGIPQIYGKDNHVLIDHGNGLKAWYVHFMNETNQGLSSLPKVGDYVTTDTVIGHLGNTGLYYTSYTGQYAGTHLHLNVTLNGKDIDPSQNWGTSPNVDCYVDTLGDDPYNGEHAENLGSIELEFIKKGNRIEFTKSNIPAPKLTAVTTENNQDYTIYGVAIKKNHPTIAKIYEEKCILWAFNCKTELRETKNINIHHAEVKAYKETWTGHWGIHQQWNDDELGRFSFTKNIPKDLHDNEHIYARSYIYGEFDCLGLKCKYGDNIFNNLNESGKSNRVLPVKDRKDLPNCTVTPNGYDRCKAGEYAREYGSVKRNPNYFNIPYNPQTGVGGNCTNFISQVLHDGGGLPEINKNGGIYNSDWFYESEAYRAPPWAGTSEYYDHATYWASQNARYEIVDSIDKLEVGDVISLAYEPGKSRFHTVVISDKTNSNIYLASNTSDYAREPWYGEDGNEGKKADWEKRNYTLVFIKVK